MALSGWCGLRGKPDCDGCARHGRAATCSCPGCANQAQNKALRAVETVVGCENEDAPAGCVNTTARADRTTFANKESG